MTQPAITQALILTANYGHGHNALANKLASHLSSLSETAVTIINISDFLVEHYDDHIKSRRLSIRYALHQQLNFGYQKASELPSWLFKIHPLVVGSRFIKSFYNVITHFYLDYIYPKRLFSELLNKVQQADVIFSVVPTSHQLIMRSGSNAIRVNLAQDFGRSNRCVWWGDFWDTFFAADTASYQHAKTMLPITSQIHNLGPMYFKSDYRQLPATTLDQQPVILFIPGKSGHTVRFEQQLFALALQCLEQGYRVVWKNNQTTVPDYIKHIPSEVLTQFTLEPKGQLKDLHQYSLVVGKGGYNQITEAFLQGTPYAAVKFLGYWERGNLSVQFDGAYLLDWTKDIKLPSHDELHHMKQAQQQLRDRLFAKPTQWQAALTALVDKKLHKTPYKQQRLMPKSLRRLLLLPVAMIFYSFGCCLLAGETAKLIKRKLFPMQIQSKQ